MAEYVGLQVEGGARLRATLRQAGADLNDLNRANASAAKVVATRAATMAPRRTGALARSVTPRGTRRLATVLSRLPYGPVIHWGWAARGITARPFLSEAAQATETTWIPLYEGALDQAINQIEGA